MKNVLSYTKKVLLLMVILFVSLLKSDAREIKAVNATLTKFPSKTIKNNVICTVEDANGSTAVATVIVTTNTVTDPFVTTWDTTIDDPGSTQIIIPVIAGAYDIDTNNDGTFDLLNQTGITTVDLGSSGLHTIAIRPNTSNTANELQIQFAGANNPKKLITIEKWGNIVWTSMEQAFKGCSNISIAVTAGIPNLSKVMNMSKMFEDALQVNSDFSNFRIWDVSGVTNMNDMFRSALEFNEDISTWNVANVTDMSGMFSVAPNFNGNINTWNVANVTNMRYMFSEAVNFSGNMNTWNVANVTDMRAMFSGAINFNGDISTWNVANVTDMRSMFSRAANFNGNINTWNVANVIDMEHMFRNATAFNGNLSTWNVANVIDMSFMFSGTTSFNGNINTWNVANVIDMAGMFSPAVGFNNSLNAWNVSKVINMRNMFDGASNFNGDISTWNVASVTNMSGMFYEAVNFTGDLSAWNVASVTNMSSMFNGAAGFNSNLSTWNVSNVGNMFNMFSDVVSFSSENYDALLLGWSALTVIDRVFFGAPPTTYCAGKPGKEELINNYGWIISGDAGLSCPFVTTWNTRIDDFPGSTQITIPMIAGAYDIDTNNDGTFDLLNQTGITTVDLRIPGLHTIAIRPHTSNTANELQIQFAGANKAKKLITIEKWGDIVWTSMEQAFRGCNNISIAATAGIPNLSKVTNMSKMFQNALYIDSDFSNFEIWNVSEITDMHAMFQNAIAFNGNISTWNVANVTDMNGMFSGAFRFNGNLNTWNVANVINMSSMFQDAEIFNGDVSTWNVANVINMSSMFSEATNFNGDVSTWNVANVTNMEAMFSEATSFNGNINTWNVANVINMSSMFSQATNFNGDVSTWNVANVTNMRAMFSRATIFNGNINTWNVANVINMELMFGGATNFNSDISTWNVTNVTDMGFMFSGAFNFNNDISTWNVAKVVDMESMFNEAFSFSSENYDALLLGWSALTVQNNVFFEAPPTTYCAGKPGKEKLINDYGWSIVGDAGLSCPGNPAIAVDDTLTIVEDTSGRVTVSNNDTVVDGLAADGYTIATNPTNGMVTEISDGVFEYTPNADFHGTDSFTYTVEDADGDMSTATVTITVIPADDALLAVDDTLTIVEDTSGRVTVSSNDTAADGLAADGYTIATNPTNGMVTEISDGVFEYTPNADFHGTDSFTYTVEDADGDMSTATVTVTVIPADDALLAVDDTLTIVEDTSGRVTVSSNDTAADGLAADGYTIATNPTNGMVTEISDGVFEYIPNADFHGTDSFTYTVEDADGDMSTATVTITVIPADDALLAVDDTLTINEDTSGSITVSNNDTVADGLAADGYTIATNPTNGMVTETSDGVFEYTPNADFHGTDSFTYTVEDADGDMSTATVTVTVIPADDALLAVDDTLTIMEDTSWSITVSNNDTVADGLAADGYTIATNPTNGMVTETSDGVFEYTPNADFYGTDSFTYTVEDADGDMSTATVTITVIPADDALLAVDDTLTIMEDTSGSITVSNNDMVADGLAADGYTIATNPINGMVTETSDGVFEYTPNADFYGTDSFTYTVEDADGDMSTATVTITVIPADDALLAVDDTLTIMEDTSGSITVSNNDMVADGLAADGYTIATNPINGMVTETSDGVFEYTPNADFHGTDSFTYTVEDADGDMSTATVTVTVRAIGLMIYNGFSPNGDGINDFLKITTIGDYSDNTIEIFNRWGNTVFKMKNYTNTDEEKRFKGVSNMQSTFGSKLPVGTYYYILNLGDGSPVRKGFIYITR